MEKILDIKLFGEQYRFKAGADDKYIGQIVDFIGENVDNVSGDKSLPLTDANKLALLLLATLNICNDYFDLKEKYDELLSVIKKKSDRISDVIDAQLK